MHNLVQGDLTAYQGRLDRLPPEELQTTRIDSLQRQITTKINLWPLGWLDRGLGAVRPPYPETVPREKNSNFSSPDLPIHPMDCSETLGKLGVPHGHPVAKRSSPKTHRIVRNRKSTLKNTSSRVPKKNAESKAFPRICEGGSPGKESLGTHV